MADSKITALTALTAADPVNDMFPIVDVSDITMAASGTTKRISVNNILSSSPTASGNFTITGDLTVDTSTLKVDATNDRVGIGTASPAQFVHLSKSSTSTALTAPPVGGASLRIQNTSSTNNNFGSVEFYNAAGLFGASINCQYTNQATPTNDLVFVVRGSGGGIEAARIDSSGNVGIGVTPSAWGAGLKALQVGATGYGALFDFNNDVIAMSANLLWTGSAYNRISASSKYALAYYQDIGGSHQWSMSSAAGTNAVAPTMNTLMTLNANGNLVLKGGTAAANGVGVTFPATQVASSDANCLDDYVESTFSPTIVGSTGGGGATYSTQIGRATKVGRLVTFSLRVAYTLGLGTGNLRVGNLPFTAGVGSVFTIYAENIALTAGNIAAASMSAGNTYISIDQLPTGGGAAAGVPYDVAGDIQISGSYIV